MFNDVVGPQFAGICKARLVRAPESQQPYLLLVLTVDPQRKSSIALIDRRMSLLAPHLGVASQLSQTDQSGRSAVFCLLEP
jgi:hypothetical protein